MRNRIIGAVAAVAVAVGGYLHLEIWRGGYRYAPVNNMFLLNVGLSAVVAIALLVRPSKLTALAGLLLAAGSLAAFGLSRGPGLPTLHGTFTEKGLAPLNVRFLGGPAAVTLLAAEAIAVILCVAMLSSRQRHGAPAEAAPAEPAPIAVQASWRPDQAATLSDKAVPVEPAPVAVPTATTLSPHEALIKSAAARWPEFPAAV